MPDPRRVRQHTSLKAKLTSLTLGMTSRSRIWTLNLKTPLALKSPQYRAPLHQHLSHPQHSLLGIRDWEFKMPDICQQQIEMVEKRSGGGPRSPPRSHADS